MVCRGQYLSKVVQGRSSGGQGGHGRPRLTGARGDEGLLHVVGSNRPNCLNVLSGKLHFEFLEPSTNFLHMTFLSAQSLFSRDLNMPADSSSKATDQKEVLIEWWLPALSLFYGRVMPHQNPNDKGCSWLSKIKISFDNFH